jgi:hypothetical protein
VLRHPNLVEKGMKMNRYLDTVIEAIGNRHKDSLFRNGRHYLEVNIGKEAEVLGITEIPDHMKSAHALVPLKEPVNGMKVRIDGRTFVDYAQFDSGVAIPGYLAREAGLPYTVFVPNDSMILNFA